MADKLKIISLGGLNEIGKNITAYEYGNDIIIVDVGMGFPDDEMYGVDVVIPDFSYLIQNRDRIRAIFITHGHEDHIGGIPYLMRDVNVPIYATRMSAGLIRLKLEEHRLDKKVKLITCEAGETVRAGKFTVEFIHINHSIADAVAFAIRCPLGVCIHTGDFKIDPTPISGGMIDLARFGELGKEGVLALLADSTNVERPGYTRSERSVGASFDALFRGCEERIIVTTFASNVDRVQQILELASEFKRKVALGGRSMLKVIETAIKAGILHCDPRLFIDVEKAEKLKDEEVVILATGTQGEPMSALTRMSSNDFNKIRVGANDTIIISASPIPGNEKDITKVIDNLYRMGAVVIYSSLADVHVSGHACQEELKLIHSLLKPKFFMPVHLSLIHI